MSDRRVLYFGCIRQTGHHLFMEGEVGSTYKQTVELLGDLYPRIDGKFCPPDKYDRQHNGSWLRTDVPPWTIISWWDRSVDSRPGSHSTFLFRGYETVEEMFAAARVFFPSVFTRQLEPLVELKL